MAENNDDFMPRMRARREKKRDSAANGAPAEPQTPPATPEPCDEPPTPPASPEPCDEPPPPPDSPEPRDESYDSTAYEAYASTYDAPGTAAEPGAEPRAAAAAGTVAARIAGSAVAVAAFVAFVAAGAVAAAWAWAPSSTLLARDVVEPLEDAAVVAALEAELLRVPRGEHAERRRHGPGAARDVLVAETADGRTPSALHAERASRRPRRAARSSAPSPSSPSSRPTTSSRSACSRSACSLDEAHEAKKALPPPVAGRRCALVRGERRLRRGRRAGPRARAPRPGRLRAAVARACWAAAAFFSAAPSRGAGAAAAALPAFLSLGVAPGLEDLAPRLHARAFGWRRDGLPR
ncbi:hypothetical protein JL720_11761 [Aureococcus anophagefferens]|nr:hypothetical protein JL720_11761 [Aureococcus anophagefferens]